MYTKEEIYIVMFMFLNELYEKNKSDTIGSLLGDMSILNGTPVDPAILEDWNKIIETENINDLISVKQGIVIIKSFLENYKTNFAMDLEDAIFEFDKMSQNEKYITTYIENVLEASEFSEKIDFSLEN